METPSGQVVGFIEGVIGWSYVKSLSYSGTVLFCSAVIIAGVIGTIAISILHEEPLNFGMPLNDDYNLRIRITKGLTSLFLLAAILQVYSILSGTHYNKPSHNTLVFSTLITILLYSFTDGYANSVNIKAGIKYKFTETNLLNNPA